MSAGFVNLYDHLSNLRLVDVVQSLSDHLTSGLQSPTSPCTVSDVKSALISSKSSKLLLQIILSHLVKIRHPFDTRSLKILVVDFMGTPCNFCELNECVVRIIRPDVYPQESGNPPKLKILDTHPLDVLVLHGFDLVYHVAPGLRLSSIESVVEYSSIGQCGIIALRALPVKFNRLNYSESNHMVLEILQQDWR